MSLPGDTLQALSLSISAQVFHDIAYKAKDRQDLLAGIDEFLDEVIVLPPGEWDPAIRIEPPKSLPSSDKRSRPLFYQNQKYFNDSQGETAVVCMQALPWPCKKSQLVCCTLHNF